MDRLFPARAVAAAATLLVAGVLHAAAAGTEGTCRRDAAAGAPELPRRTADAGVVLMQRHTGGLTRAQGLRGRELRQQPLQQTAEDPLLPDALTPLVEAPAELAPAETEEQEALDALSGKVQELKDLVEALRFSMQAQVAACCKKCNDELIHRDPPKNPPVTSVNITNEPLPGLCATFGDPHFTTFDGAHTILLADMTVWLVKSERVWIQAVSKLGTGNLMGIAVGGSFMGGHTLIMYNNTDLGRFRVLYDDTPILEDQDANGNAEYSAPFGVWAARRDDWDMSLHDKAILEMDPIVNFTVGSWPSRFQDNPMGGLYLFRFPDSIEVTASGVDFMSVVIKMLPQKPKQSGYCGNFDGNDADEFLPPINGSVPPLLEKAWNRPIGEGTGPVDDKDNLFLRVNETVQFIHPFAPSLAQISEAPVWKDCEERLQKAEDLCKDFPDMLYWKDCIIDYCLTGRVTAAKDLATAELLTEGLNKRGIPVFAGHGHCVDANGNGFRTMRANGVKLHSRCRALLHDLAAVDEHILGAQMQVGSACEILLDPGVDAEALETLIPPGGWEAVTQEGGGENAGSFIASIAEDLSWSCWRLN